MRYANLQNTYTSQISLVYNVRLFFRRAVAMAVGYKVNKDKPCVIIITVALVQYTFDRLEVKYYQILFL